MTAATILQIEGLSFAYADQPPIARRWSTRIAAGVTLLHGDTGSGKSTLLRLLAGTEAVDGVLTLCGARIDADAVAYRCRVYWHVPGSDAFDALTPREHAAAVTADGHGFDEAAWQRHAEGFGLGPHLHKPMYALSTGSRRKSGLAAALASAAALTLLDDPAAALDAASVAYLKRALAASSAPQGRAIVVASSDELSDVPLAGTIMLPLR